MSEHPPNGAILGFDFGLKRIGVAVANSDADHAKPLTTLTNYHRSPAWDTITRLVETWRPIRFVVGKTDTAIKKHINEFARELEKRYACPVAFSEEAYTSTEAKLMLQELRQRGYPKKIKKEDLDKLSAALILESWLSDNGY